MDIREDAQEICVEIAGVLRAVDNAATEQLIEALIASRRIFVAGAGRSGWIARCMAMRLMHLDRVVHVVGDATTPRIESGDLLIACSGSGETPTIVACIEAVRRTGARVALITACPDATAAGQADIVVHLPAPTPKAQRTTDATSVQPMGSLFEQSLLIFGDALVMLLAERLRIDHHDMWRRHTNIE